jgi:DNA-binding NarL/FixJ family response regulator
MRLEIEPDIEVIGEAEDGSGALRALDEVGPCVVVLDYELPDMNGIEVADAVAGSGRPCAIVMLTIHDTAALKQAAARAGCCAFVAKHESSDALLAAIRRAAQQMPSQYYEVSPFLPSTNSGPTEDGPSAIRGEFLEP